MTRIPFFISNLNEAAVRLCCLVGQISQDRLELLALELREAKIRLIKGWILACLFMIFSVVGLMLLVLAGFILLPAEWRILGLFIAASISLILGLVLFNALKRHMRDQPLAFEQSMAELAKDLKCFSTKS